MNRLINIEGISGSGKTTFAKMLFERFKDENVHLYLEGDLHPADMAWCALLTEKDYEWVCSAFEHHKQALEDNKLMWNDNYIIAYTKIENIEQELFDYFESKEIFDSRVSLDTFKAINFDRWGKFGQDADGIYIFESALIQSAVNELMLFNKLDETEICLYIRTLCDKVKNLNPIVVYIDVDTKATLKRAGDQRVDKDNNRIWEDGIIKYIENSPYGIANNLQGYEGMVEYFDRRKLCEKRIIESLPVEKYFVRMDIDKQSEITSLFIDQLCGNL